MRVKLTNEQKIADRFLRAYDLVDDRLESSLAGLERAESARSSIPDRSRRWAWAGIRATRCANLSRG